MTADPVEHDLDLLAALAEDRLNDVDRARCFEHLAACATCREALAVLMRELKPEPAVSVAGGRRVGWLAVAAAAVIAVGLGYHVMKPEAHLGSTGPTPTTVAVPVEESGRGVSGQAQREPDRGSGAQSAEGLAVRRSAERTVGGKKFRLVAGEWIDDAYRPGLSLSLVDIKTPAARTEWLQRVPALQPFAALGNRVSVVVDGVVYRFDLPSSD
jgi:hypothetical protein